MIFKKYAKSNKKLQILNTMVELITETHVKHHMRKWQNQTTQRK